MHECADYAHERSGLHIAIIAVLAIVFAGCELFANCSSSCYDCWPFKAISWHWFGPRIAFMAFKATQHST